MKLNILIFRGKTKQLSLSTYEMNTTSQSCPIISPLPRGRLFSFLWQSFGKDAIVSRDQLLPGGRVSASFIHPPAFLYLTFGLGCSRYSLNICLGSKCTSLSQGQYSPPALGFSGALSRQGMDQKGSWHQGTEGLVLASDCTTHQHVPV